MKCKTKTPTVSVHQIINKKGRPMLQGNCCKCKCKKSGGSLITIAATISSSCCSNSEFSRWSNCNCKFS